MEPSITRTNAPLAVNCPGLEKFIPLFPAASPMPEGLNPAAQAARAQFDDAYQAILRKVQKIALNILVWGPSPASPVKVAQKRICIRQALISLGHNAFFSEDYSFSVPPGGLKLAEFAQAITADLIIALVEDAPGALAEVSNFGNHPAIAHNVLVMCPHRLRSTYAGQAALSILDEGFGAVYWYSEDEIDTCGALTKAVRRAEARRQIRAFGEENWN